MMHYSAYYPFDVVNGAGIRSTLFVSGCSHKCSGCHNAVAINPKHGDEFTNEMLDKIIIDLKDTRVNRAGLSLSGGDPLYKDNLDMILHIVKTVKSQVPEKNIWMWTGYKFDELDAQRLEIVKYVDVLIDGKFVKELKDLKLKFRGSSNQQIINVQEVL